MLDVILKRFETPDETRVFSEGHFKLIRIGSMTIGRACYAPGFDSAEASANQKN